ncbi:MAG TPA: glutamyl-tRNA reductase, partial [Acidimicrobiia bacterium]
LTRREHLAEAVLLSTCNRTEVYAHATLFHPAMQDVRDFLADVSGVDPDDFSDLLYAYHDDAAVAHLFGVAAGLDSMIIGEGEILGQVREAWQTAEREGAAGPMLSRTFRHAVEVGKRARTETAIGRHPVSVSSAAVSLAEARLGSLDDRRVLLVGAGEMGEGMALALSGAGALEIVVANRTLARGRALSERVGGRAIRLEAVPGALLECDVVLVSTGGSDLLVERSTVESVMTARDGRALLIVDVGVPRNVDPGAGDVFGVTLLDIDDLRALGEQSLAQRRQEIGRVRDIIAEELDRHRLERSAREVAPLVTALRARGEQVRAVELERFRSRIESLDPAAREVVEAITQGIVNKLLHEPTVRVKDAAGTARGDLYADALAELFDLPEPPATAER